MAEASPDKQVLRKIGRDLMVGLVYPVVLGSILYSAVDVVALQCTLIWDARRPDVDIAPDGPLLLRLILLGLTILFYGCDFMYSFLTNNFKLRFFAYDVVFLTGLYLTVYAIGVGPTDAPAIETRVISACYLIFLALYWLWDENELRDASADETPSFERVIRWEKRSLLVFGVVLLIAFVAHEQWWSAAIVAAALVYVTYEFAYIVFEKAKVSRAYRAA